MLKRVHACIVPALLLSCFSALAQDASLILPEVSFPAENPFSESKRILGKILFWEEQLSTDDSVACGTCHKPGAGGADNRISLHPGPDLQFDTDNETFGSPGTPLYDANLRADNHPAFGFAPQVTRRASQSVLTAMYADAAFWDGRAPGQLTDPLSQEVLIENGAALESQALIPILSTAEMGHVGRSWQEVSDKLTEATPLALASNLPEDMANALQGDSSYPDLFTQAYGDPAITPVRIAMAIATYERTLLPDESPFDLYVRGNTAAMSEDQIAGWELFRNSVCSQCHVPPLFTDNSFARTGLRSRFDDNGLQVVTKDSSDFAHFKVPSLRNVGLRNALTHVGWISDVQDAIDFYNSGTHDTGHTMFTNGLSSVPDPDNPGQEIRIDEIDFFADDPTSQALVVDFLSNALTDPRAAAETTPFDRPILGSEQHISATNLSTNPASTSKVTTRVIADNALSLAREFSTQQKIFINQSITVEEEDRGKPGNLYIVVAYKGKYFMRNSQGQFKAWSGKASDLQPFAEKSSLTGEELISFVENLSGIPGSFQVFTGYSAQGRLVYSTSPFHLVIR